MTREELKIILASKANKLAGQAIEIIKAGKPLLELEAVVESGAAHIFYERDPSHPRSKFLTKHVLDACFESRFDVISKENFEGGTSALLGNVHESEGREKHFRYLLDRGFTPGTTNWRGGLFRHIFHSCFYGENTESARRFAKELFESGKADVNETAKNDYAWTNHPDQLAALIEMGADPTYPGILDCALRYLGCATNGSYTVQDRVDIVTQLLDAGAVPTLDLGSCISWQQIRYQLTNYGLLDRMVDFGVINKEDSEAYTRWLSFQKAS